MGKNSTSLARQALSMQGKGWNKGTETVKKNHGNIRRLSDRIEKKFGLERIKDLKSKHVESVVKDLKAEGKGNGTIAGYLTASRQIAESIGKQNIVAKENRYYGVSRAGERLNPVKTDLGKQAEIRQALYGKAQWLGLAHDMRQAYGLRAKESLMSNKIQVDAHGNRSLIVEAAKGGRSRTVPIDNEKKEQILARVQSYIRENGQKSIIPSDKSLKKAYEYQRDTLHKLGATKANSAHAHSQRHAYAQGRAQETDRLQVAEELGHGRIEVVSHYVPR